MKIDTNKIEGYNTMTPEQKLAALESFEVEAPENGEVETLRKALSKSNTEAAEYKRQLKARMSEDEEKELQAREEKESMMNEISALKKEKTISSHTAAYVALGYDPETAVVNAEALYKGDMNTIFANHKAFIEQQKKAAAATAINSQPDLSKGQPLSGKAAEEAETAQFRKYLGL